MFKGHQNWLLSESSGEEWGTCEKYKSIYFLQIASNYWIIEKAREFQKITYFCFIDYPKSFVWITTNCEKFLKIWEYQTTLSASWETCIRSTRSTSNSMGHGTIDWFQIGKGVRQGCILSPCLLNFYAEYIMRNAGLGEAQAGIKISRRNISTSDMQTPPPLWP